jgi:hypothetical protein
VRITQHKYLPPLLVSMHTTGSVGERTNYLDAEDHHFIELVGKRGKLAEVGAVFDSYRPKREGDDQNGSMRFAEARSRDADRSRSVFFNDEMLAYWKHRWAFEDDCERERRLAYEEEQRARERIREQYRRDRRTAAGELEREELAWTAEQEKRAQERQERLLATMKADAEWEAAKPQGGWANNSVADTDFEEERQARYELPERHYVPYWKRHELETEFEEAHRKEEEVEHKIQEETREREQELSQEERAVQAKRRLEAYAEQQWLAHFDRYPPLRRSVTD